MRNFHHACALQVVNRNQLYISYPMSRLERSYFTLNRVLMTWVFIEIGFSDMGFTATDFNGQSFTDMGFIAIDFTGQSFTHLGFAITFMGFTVMVTLLRPGGRGNHLLSSLRLDTGHIIE